MKHVRLALGRSGVGGRFPRHRRRRCRRRLRRCRHILGIPFRPGAIFSSVAGSGAESFDYIPTLVSWCQPNTALMCGAMEGMHHSC